MGGASQWEGRRSGRHPSPVADQLVRTSWMGSLFSAEAFPLSLSFALGLAPDDRTDA